MNLRKMIRALAIAGLASTLIYAALLLLTDWQDVIAALADFPLDVFLLILLLSIGCYVVRGLRWGLLMRLVGYRVSPRDALYLHFSGQTMSVSPGRVGEVLKPWLSKETVGMPMSRGIPLVFAERVADLIAVSLLSLGGISLVGGGTWSLIGMTLAIFLGAGIAGSRRFHDVVLRLLLRQSWAQRHRESAHVASETVRLALSWKASAWSILASIVAWGLEGIGFWLCITTLGFDTSGPAAVSIYAISTIIGAVSFLPGGIGLTEASMAGILVAAGMPGATASAATVITRVATLWLAVSIGWLALASRPVLFRTLLSRDDASTE